MGLILDREKGNYKVTELILEHNYTLQLPQTSHLLVSQRKILELQGFEIETTDDVGIGPKAAHELAFIQVGGSLNLSYTLRDHKNYLRAKRQREMAYGQAGSMLMYFQEKIAENHHSNMHCKWTGENKYLIFFWLMLKCSLTMHILVMLSVLILLLKQTSRVGFLEYLLGSIILDKLWFLVLFSYMMRHLSLSNGYLRPF
jgi:zinc finger SWIM domain-containing protein 3